MISNQSLRILLAAESLGQVQAFKTLLRESNSKHDLTYFTTLNESMLALGQQTFDIFILDAAAPDTAVGSARTTIFAKLSELTLQIPIVCTTDSREVQVPIQLAKAGAHDVLLRGQFDGKMLQKSISYAQKQFKENQHTHSLIQKIGKIEKQLIENEQLTNTGSWQMDLISNEMIWSDQLYRLFGFIPNSVDASVATYLKYVHREDKQEVELFFENIVKDGKSRILQHRIILEGSHIRYFGLFAKIYFDETTSKLVMFGSVQDLTPIKAQEQLNQDKMFAVQATKIKENLQSEICSHIYPALAGLSQTVGVLEQYRKDATVKSQIMQLKSVLEQLSMLNGDLSNKSLISGDYHTILESEPFDSPNFINNILQFTKLKSVKHDLILSTEIDENIPEKLIGDARYLSLAINNMSQEIVKLAASEGAKLMFRINVSEASEADTKLHFTFKYKGKILSAARLKALNQSEKFLEERPKNAELGLELMLGVAAKIARLMGGGLEVQNRDSGTTQFTFIAPLRLPTPSAAPVANSVALPKNLKILIAEDHFLNQIALKKILQNWSEKITIDIAENGLICVEKSKNSDYDLILMDLQMPIMDGLEAAKRIRERSDIPIVAMSPSGSKQEMERCRELGIAEYLSKPYQSEELYAKILSAISKVGAVARA